jgi:hypothetical protein
MTLRSEVATLQSRVTTLESQMKTLESEKADNRGSCNLSNMQLGAEWCVHIVLDPPYTLRIACSRRNICFGTTFC